MKGFRGTGLATKVCSRLRALVMGNASQGEEARTRAPRATSAEPDPTPDCDKDFSPKASMDALLAEPAVNPVNGAASASRPVVIPVDDEAAQHCSLAQPAVNPVDGAASSSQPDDETAQRCSLPTASLQSTAIPVGGEAPLSTSVIPCRVPLRGKATPPDRGRAILSPSSFPWTTRLCNPGL